jgi:serine/threonine protein phosphatase PrpC
MGWVRDLLKKGDTPANEGSPAGELGTWRASARQPVPHMLQVGRASNVGQVRDHNEDVLLTLEVNQLGDQAPEPLGWFVLADGMGGHQAGELASALAMRVVTYELLNQVLRPYLFNEAHDATQRPLNEVMANAVMAANKAVHEQVQGGGTTLTCALILGNRAYLAHVGDSRAYMFADDHLRQITRDHSLVDRLVELGQITPSEAMHHPQRNVLYRAVGQGDPLEVDTYVELLPPSGQYRLLLCCDGLWGSIPDDQITEVLRMAATPQAACDRLIEAANAAGGKDNITAVVIGPPSPSG